jgi:hypothetical protein
MLEINTRTNQYADYFLPSTIKLWNNLPLTLRKTESLSIFNKNLKNQNAGLALENLIQPSISLELPVPSQDHYGFHSFLVVD